MSETTALALPGLTPVANALRQIQPALVAALPSHLKAERMTRIVLTSVRKNPKLLQCDLRSLLGAVMVAAQMGLEPDGTLGEAYLVPYGRECQLIPGYKGLMKLARQSGQISTIVARVVHARDHFLFEFGLSERLEHRPFAGEGAAGDLLWVYAIARMRDGGVHVDVMSKADVLRIRDGSSGYQYAKKAGKPTPWDTHFEEMAKKTIVRRLCKMLPASTELARAVAMDEAADAGVAQGLVDALEAEGVDLPAIEAEAPPEGKRMKLAGRKQADPAETTGQVSGTPPEDSAEPPATDEARQ